MEFPVMKSSPLKESVKKYIKEHIANGIFLPGAKIPTVRALSTELNISHVVIAEAFQELAAENILISKIGSGTVVATKLPFAVSHTPAGIRNLYFFFVLYKTDVLSSWHAEVLARIQEKARQKNWDVKIDFLSAEKFLQASRDPHAVGIIHTTTLLNMPKINLPVVSYGMSPSTSEECCVSPDNYGGGAMAVRHLLDLQCSKIAFVSYHSNNLDHHHYPAKHVTERLRGVNDSCREWGIPLPQVLRWDILKNQEEVARFIAENEAKEQRIGLIIANRNMAVEIRENMHEWMKGRVDDLVLTTFINRKILGEHCKIDTFDFSRDELAEQCVQIIEQMRRGIPPPARTLLKMRLI